MPRIQHSVHINRPPLQVFEITNEIDKWTVLFDEYGQSEIISKEDCGRFTKLVFRLRNNEGAEWQSWRILDHKELVAIAQREAPLHPFRYMHLTWTYTPDEGGTLMTWTQDFELDPAYGVLESKVVAQMNNHGMKNQQRIKHILESSASAKSSV